MSDEMNFSEFQAYARQGARSLRMFQAAEGIANKLMQYEAQITKLKDRIAAHEKECSSTEKEKDINASKLKILKKDIEARNITIGDKNKKIEKLHNYLEGGYHTKEAELASEFQNKKCTHDDKCKDLDKERTKKAAELATLDRKIAERQDILQKMKKTFESV